MIVPNLSQHKSNYRIGTLSKKSVTAIAKANGFEQRKSGAITANLLLVTFMNLLTEKGKTYSDWARSLSLLIGRTVSKQAIYKRMAPAWTATVKAVLQHVFSVQVQQQCKHHIYATFNNVWLQDSTSLHLPDIFRFLFVGNYSNGKTKAVAKLNVVLNAFTGACAKMEWMSFTVNEQKLSPSIMQVAAEGDLIMRDLGYFSLDMFKQFQENDIYYLSRLKYGVILLDPLTGKKINLKKLLKGKLYIDRELVCGKDIKLKTRLVAIKLSAEHANERKRKASQNRDKRLNHDEEYYKLLDYIIFITNVENTVWGYKQVAEAYRLRWNIEILFKSWKSGLSLTDIIPNEKEKTDRLESILYLILIYIAWFQMLIYIPLRWAKELAGKCLSIIKITKFMVNNIEIMLFENLSKPIIKQIIYHCCYDKRPCRINAEERLRVFYNILS